MTAVPVNPVAASSAPVDVPLTDPHDSAWKLLYTIGGVAALFTAAMTIVGVVSYLLWPPPEGSVVAWFEIYQRNWLIGMLGLDLLILLSYIALIPVVVALAVALRRDNPSLITLAGALGLIAIVTYFASSRVFELLALSQQYAVATSDAERSSLIAAGQSMLTTYLGSFAPPVITSGASFQGTSFNISFVLWSIAGILLSIVMLRSRAFGRIVGYAGILGNIAVLGLFVPVVGVALSLISLPILLVWYSLIGRGLLRLGRHTRVRVPIQHAAAAR